MNSYRDVIDLWDKRLKFAKEIGIKPARASAWWQRNSIPPDWYRRVAEVAAEKGGDFAPVTLDLLVTLAEKRSSHAPEQGEAA